MPEPGEATLRLSNATAAPLCIWLEPWVDEFMLLPRSELALHVITMQGDTIEWPEIEGSDAMLTVWGSGGTRLRVEIDGVAQDSFSAGYTAPDMGPLTSRSFVKMAFGGFPEARPGGHPLIGRRQGGWLSRLLRWRPA